jgi:hypothetical protein
MAYIKKLKDNELIGGTDNTDVYPVTSTEAVYNKENVSQEYINNHVDGSKIVDGTVTNNKIAPSTISMSKLNNEVQTLIQQGASTSLSPMGEFDIEAIYWANDMVYDPATNSSYVSLRADNMGHPVTDETWWMKVVDGSYVNTMVEELEQAIAQAIEDAQEDIDDAIAGANTAAQSANTAAANAEAKIDWVEEQVDSLTAYEVATELDETSIIPVQNKVVSKEINNANSYLKGDVRTLAVGQTYAVDEAVKTADGKMRRMTKEVKSLNLADTTAVGGLKTYNNATYRALKAVAAYNSATTYEEGDYAVGRPAVVTITVDTSELSADGNINVAVAGVEHVIAVTTTSTPASIATNIVEAVGSIDGWTITDNENGTITIKCNTAGANTLAFSYTDVDETGVVVSAATTAGAATISVYNGSSWNAATLAGMATDTALFTSVDAAWLETNTTVQNSVHYELSKIVDYTEMEVQFTDGKYYSGMWNKNVGDTVTYATHNTTNNGVTRFNCVEGEIFSISACVESSRNPTVCFISAENKILSLYRGTPALIDSIWVAPKGAVQLAIQSRPDVTRRVLRVGKLAEWNNKVEKEDYYKDKAIDKFEWINNWVVARYYNSEQLPNHVGIVAPLSYVSNHSDAMHQIVPCVEGDVFWVNLSAVGSITCCAFLDSANRVIAAEGKSVSNKYVVAPQGSVKVVFTGHKNSSYNDYIRTQRVHRMYNIKDVVKSYLDDKRINITFWQAGVYAIIPNVGEVMNYTLTDIETQFHQIIECTENDCFYLKVSNESAQLKASPLIFVDVNDVVVWRSDKIMRDYQYYQAPKNAAKMICQTNVYSDLIYRVGKIDYNTQRLHNVVGRDETWRFYGHLGYLVNVVNTPIGEEVTDFTTLPSVIAHSRYALFECNAGDAITVDQGVNNSWDITFLNANNIVLDRISNVGRNFSAVAPSGAVKVHVTAWTGISGAVVSASCGGVIAGFDSRIQQLESGFDYPYKIVCPDVFYAVAGYQKNVYKDTLIRGMDDGLNSPMGLTIDFECPSFNHQGWTNVGIRRPRMWQLSGSLLNSHKGTFTFRINVFNQKGIRIDYKDCKIKVINATPLTENKNILCVGDSLTAGGQIVATCYNRFAALNGVTPTFWGSRTSTVGDVTVKHEGRSGWEWSTFTTSSSPFYIGGKVDITAYRNSLNMGEEKFDLVIFCLGVNNSVLSTGNGMSNAITLINAFLADNPDTKFILQLQPADNNTSDGWEVYAKDLLSYGIKEIYKNNTWNARQAALNTFNNDTWAGKVYIGDAVMSLDRYYGYPYEEQASSDRISVMEIRHTNCVHPNVAGYNQLGDGYFYQALAILNGEA